MKLRYTGKAPETEISQVFAPTMEELLRSDEKVVYLDADLMASLKTQKLWEKYPERILNCGIQEANMVGVAAGLYLAGYKPYIHSFAPFITRRVFDQVFISIGYGHKSVHLIGSDVGIMATDNGGTHMCFEDIALIRTIPDSCIIDVTDATMFVDLLHKVKDRGGVTYFRTARRNMPDVYEADTSFEIGQGKVLIEGQDVTIIASGIMVATALQAAEILKQERVSARVVDPITVKPLDRALILKCAHETGAMVTAENHSVNGGLGGAIAELISESIPIPVQRVGVREKFGQVGTEAFLRQQYHLEAKDIVEKAHAAISLKR